MDEMELYRLCEAFSEDRCEDAIIIMESLIRQGEIEPFAAMIGDIYYAGRGSVAKDSNKAVGYYFKGALEGCKLSQVGIAKVYIGKQEYEEATKWLFEAGLAGGNFYAIEILNWMSGEGFFSTIDDKKMVAPQNNILANVREEIIKSGDKEKQKKMNELEQRISKHDIKKAEELRKELLCKF